VELCQLAGEGMPRLNALPDVVQRQAAKDQGADCDGTRLIVRRRPFVDDGEELFREANPGGCGKSLSACDI